MNKTGPGKATLTKRAFGKLFAPRPTIAPGKALLQASLKTPPIAIGNRKITLQELHAKIDAATLETIVDLYEELGRTGVLDKYPRVRAHAIHPYVLAILDREGADVAALELAVSALLRDLSKLPEEQRQRLSFDQALLRLKLGRGDEALDALEMLLAETLEPTLRFAAIEVYFADAATMTGARREQARQLYASLNAKNALFDRDEEIGKLLAAAGNLLAPRS